MNVFFCIMIFIMGSFFGSFFTLAVYRLPLKKDITHERSFCPNCNHRLEFLDLIPIFSYIFLRGKCRYCGEKIRIRYLLLEVLSGIMFVLFYLSYNMNYPFLNFLKTLELISLIFMYVVLVLIAGIDKERRIIQKNVLIFGFIFNIVFNLIRYFVLNIRFDLTLIINTVIGILALIIFSIYMIYVIKKDRKDYNYIIDIIMVLVYVLTTNNVFLFGIILGLITIVSVINRFVIIKDENKSVKLGFIISIITIGCRLIYNFVINYGLFII